MKARNSAVFLFSILFFSSVLFFISGCSAGASTPRPNVATSMASISERIPTDTPIPPTPTIPPEEIVKDLTGVKLNLEDFPQGFKALSSSDLKDMNMDPATLAAGVEKDLIKASVHNPAGFMRQEGKQIELVVGMVVYPLTILESSGFDADLADPEKQMKDFVDPKGTEAKILESSQEIGDRSLGFEYKLKPDKPDNKPMRVQMVLARRSNALMMIMSFRMDGQTSQVQAVELAKKLDTRLADALSK